MIINPVDWIYCNYWKSIVKKDYCGECSLPPAGTRTAMCVEGMDIVSTIIEEVITGCSRNQDCLPPRKNPPQAEMPRAVGRETGLGCLEFELFISVLFTGGQDLDY